MNVPRNELLERYREKVLLVQVAERDRGRGELVRSAVQYLNTVDPQQRFSDPIVAIFSTNISAKSSFDFPAAKNAFSIMEKYVINLLDCPWKREFRKITMYSGFYKTQIESPLKDAWRLLLMAGYEKVGMSLELKLLPDVGRLHNVAFEFYLASLECLIYTSVSKMISSLGFTMKDYHQYRTGISIGPEELSLFKALSKFLVSETRDERERRGTKTSSQVQEYLSKWPNSQLSEKTPEYETKFGSKSRVGGTQSEGKSHGQMERMPITMQLHEPNEEGNASETRSESFEAMLRDITPEMISNANVRRQILTKLIARPHSAKSSDDLVHVSLPPHQVQRETDPQRPYTEPLFLPKQPNTGATSASDIQPYLESLLMPKHLKTGMTSVLDTSRAFTEPLLRPKRPKTGVTSASDMRPFTEPLFTPKQTKHGVTSASDMRPFTEPLFTPKQTKHGVTSASDIRPFTAPLFTPKQAKHGVTSASDMRPFTEPISTPKQTKHGVTSASDMRPFTEPLFTPKQSKTGVTSASDIGLRPFTEPLLTPKHPQN